MSARKRRISKEISIPELRHLLLEKHKGIHSERLAHYQATGRISPNTSSGLNRQTPIEPDLSDGVEKSERELHAGRKQRSKRVDTWLLIIEGVAAVGLIGILLVGYNSLRSLNREVSSALQQPEVTPTALLTAVILPGGHTPPNSPEGAQPNDSEIPAHLMPIVQSLANIPIPTASPEQAIRIQIPSINVDAPVVQGDGWDQLRKGVGQHINDAEPGKPGNLILSAHNDVFGEIFRHLDQLKTGDSITVFTSSRQYNYKVTASLIVEPTRVEVMQPTGEQTVTLISCYPYLINNKRIVIQATLQQ